VGSLEKPAYLGHSPQAIAAVASCSAGARAERTPSCAPDRTATPGRLHQMDGLRGIAMLLVFMGHFGTVWSQMAHPAALETSS
jgi:uncharacterized membrane protein